MDDVPVNSYVKLKKGYDATDMYRNVDAGATGWIRDRKVDYDGFTMVFIEWDETNPKYAGEIDKWAFESHFEVISTKANEPDSAERYIESIRIATDAALAAEGFILISVSKVIENKQSIYEPTVHSGQLNQEVGFILEAQVAHMASTLYQEYVKDALSAVEILESLIEEEEDESGR